ncbi:MAG: type III secretion system export apparatus subunit SctR [Planctomycetota bacterium]
MEVTMPEPLYLVVVLLFLGLAPFVGLMVTSFIKIVVVLSLIRNALGVQSIPPNMVINGLAIILTIHIMNPVAQEMFDTLRQQEINAKDFNSLQNAAAVAKEPLKEFLLKHSSERERAFFYNSAKRLWPEERHSLLTDQDMLILVPAFTVSELTSAFQIGFLVYLPFIAIDIIVSNILLAMGMMMVSPMTISLPFKLLLFVVVDGWTRLIHALVLTYV